MHLTSHSISNGWLLLKRAPEYTIGKFLSGKVNICNSDWKRFQIFFHCFKWIISLSIQSRKTLSCYKSTPPELETKLHDLNYIVSWVVFASFAFSWSGPQQLFSDLTKAISRKKIPEAEVDLKQKHRRYRRRVPRDDSSHCKIIKSNDKI